MVEEVLGREEDERFSIWEVDLCVTKLMEKLPPRVASKDYLPVS